MAREIFTPQLDGNLVPHSIPNRRVLQSESCILLCNFSNYPGSGHHLHLVGDLREIGDFSASDVLDPGS